MTPNQSTGAAQITTHEALDILVWSIGADKPVLLSGAPGLGKSALGDRAAAITTARLMFIHGVVCDPTDAKGMPVSWIDPETGETRAGFVAFGDLRALIEATELTVCFLDDLGQSPPAVQAAFMQLIYHPRQVNGQAISPHVRFIAATNRRQDRAGVSGILEPVKSRFVGGIYEVVPNLEDWIADYADPAGVDPMVIACLRNQPELFCQLNPTLDLCNSSNPRTVTAAAELYTDPTAPKHLLTKMYEGIAGTAWAAAFSAFVQIYDRMPGFDEILRSPETARVPDKEDTSVQYAIVTGLCRRVTLTNWENAAKYVAKLPTEFQMLFVKDTTRLLPELAHTSTFAEYAQRNHWIMK